MGSSLSPILSNIFVNNLESKIVQKYLDTGKIKFYSRFADDSLIIIHKNSIRSFLREINNFDKSLNFTVDYMDEENSIKFLDIDIFLNTEEKIEFKKYRKNSVDTVICNFEQSISSPKYKKGSILTNIHREFDASSSQENFLETLEELKEVYSQNSYPSALINSKIQIFLANREKPIRPPTNHTICLEYSSPLIEHSICDLTRKMEKILPEFRVNVAYRAVKVSKLFSFMAKPQIEIFEKSNVVYLYTCPCEEKYIGQTKRLLRTRIKDHQYDSVLTNVHLHNLCCDKYQSETQKYIHENSLNYTSGRKAKFDYFQNRFKIIGRGFRSTKDREKTEAFLIRTQRPSLNDQIDSKAFKLF